MEYVRIVAIDLSLTATGWADFCCLSKRLSFGVCPEFRSKQKDNDDRYDLERLSHILTFVKAHVDPQSLVIVEDFAFARANQAHQLGGLGYLVRFWLWQQGITFLTVAPSALKRFVAGKGNAPKELMIMNIFKNFSVEPGDNNSADAIGLNFIGRSLMNEYEPRNAHQRSVVVDLKKKYAQVLECF